MEKVIINHSKEKHRFLLISEKFRFEFGKKVDPSNDFKVPYHLNDFPSFPYHFELEQNKNTGHFDTKIIFQKNLITKLTFGKGFISLQIGKTEYAWRMNGSLVREIYYRDNSAIIHRRIFYVHEAKIVDYELSHCVYDLKELLNKGFRFRGYLLMLYPRELLNKIADGDLSLVLPEHNILFYTDSERKVNAICSYKRSYNYLKENSVKVIEEAEKLRLDPRNYVPEILR